MCGVIRGCHVFTVWCCTGLSCIYCVVLYGAVMYLLCGVVRGCHVFTGLSCIYGAVMYLLCGVVWGCHVFTGLSCIYGAVMYLLCGFVRGCHVFTVWCCTGLSCIYCVVLYGAVTCVVSCYRGSAEATRQAHNLITALIRDSDRDVEQMIPRLKAKAAASTNNPLALATNVWHNSMANSVPSTSSTTFSCSPLVSHRGGAAVVTTVSTVVQTTQVLATRSQMSSTEISTTHVATGAWGNATFPPLGRVSGSKVMSNGPVVTGQSQGGKSGVSRQLFPQEKSAAAQQHAMYTSPATANTKVVSMSAMNPAAEVDAKVASSAGKSLSKVPGSGRHPPGVQVTKIASEPQLLPILTCGQTPPPTGNMTCRSHAAVSPVPTAVTLPPGEYSPFNNLFGKVAENVIGQKNDLGGSMEHRVNFANVAGSGAMAPTSNAIQMGMVAPPGGHSQPDESLQAKAPGYKAPGQRVPGMEGMSGYKGGMAQHGSQQPSFPYGVPGSFSTLYSQGPLGGAVPPMMPDMSGGGMPGMGFGMPPLMGMMSSMDPGRHSPRLDAFGFPPSNVRTEYSTQDRPMTLPKIDSNLNPNAPNFTSMFLQRQRRQQAAAAASRMAMAPGGGIMPGGADAMPGGGAADAIPGGPDMMPPMPHPAFRVPMQVGVPKAYNGNVITSPPPPQQPPIGNNAFHQAPPESNVSDFTPSLGAPPRFNPLIGSAPFIGVASTPQPPPKQFSPLASSVARSSSTPSSVGASSKGKLSFTFYLQSPSFFLITFSQFYYS